MLKIRNNFFLLTVVNNVKSSFSENNDMFLWTLINILISLRINLNPDYALENRNEI